MVRVRAGGGEETLRSPAIRVVGGGAYEQLPATVSGVAGATTRGGAGVGVGGGAGGSATATTSGAGEDVGAARSGVGGAEAQALANASKSKSSAERARGRDAEGIIRARLLHDLDRRENVVLRARTSSAVHRHDRRLRAERAFHAHAGADTRRGFMSTTLPRLDLPSFFGSTSASAAPGASPLDHLDEGVLARISALAKQVEERALGASRGRVLILPGLPGTSLGVPGRLIDDTVWLDAANVVRGRLTELSVTSAPSSIAALHAIPEIYFQLYLRLVAQGYDVDYHPFDWRRSVVDLGRELADRVQREGREVHVVAHSFGGLVARSALVQGAGNLGKIILLGTPNHGTFTTIQGIRGDHWLLRSLSAFDVVHDTAQLGAVFGTWPSIYEQLPTRRALPNLDLYATSSWPRSGLQPSEQLLTRAPEIQEALAPVRGQLFIIAGHGRTTIDGVEVRDDAFQYRRSTDGDGWVPTSFVELDGVPSYYTTAAHIGMMNSEVVLAATVNLLDHGRTDRLPQTRPAGVARPGITEARPMPPRFGGRTGFDLTLDDVRALVGQLLAEDPPDADD